MKFAVAATTVALVASSVSANPLLNLHGGLTSKLGGVSTPLCKQQYLGAVGRPWEVNSKPGFTCGKLALPTLPMWDGGDKALCGLPLLAWTPFCRSGNAPAPLPTTGCKPPTTNNPHPYPDPTPECPNPKPNPPPVNPGGPVCQSDYQVTYTNFTTVADSGAYKGKVVGAATIDNDNYLTYALADSADACLKACSQMSACHFVNTYYDEEVATDYAPKRGGQMTCAFFRSCASTLKNTNWGGQGNDRPLNTIKNSNGYCLSPVCQS